MKNYLTFLFLFFCFVLLGQDKPKLGVVLSGGGAKGIAHIGILKAMEEAGLRPDFIAGTSMGSIVGGLYSIGYSADEIEQMVLDIDWNEVLANRVPLNYISFEEKEYYGRYLLELPVDGVKPKIPSGLIEGHILSELLHYYTWPSIPYESFDDFPVVYRCVATDVKNGKPIVFDRGPLQRAIRASMALPTAFTAVDLDSTLAVDGGVVKNFPVDEMKALGADYIIGVDVSFIEDAEVPESMVGILMNLAMIQSDQSMPEQIDLCDLYIHPDMEGYSTGSFGSAKEILKIGDKTGAKYLDQFKAIAEEIEMNREPLNSSDRVKPYVLDSIRFKGNRLFGDQLIQNKLGLEKGDTVTRDQVREAIRRVYGINGFKDVVYQIKQTEEDRAEMVVDMREKLPTRLFASLHIDNVFETGLLLNLTARDFLLRESRALFIVDISSNPKFRFDYYKYAGPKKSFAVNLRYDYISREVPIYSEGDVSDVLINRQQELQFNVLTTQSLKHSFLLGGFYQTRKDRSDFGVSLPSEIGNIIVKGGGIQLGYFRNSLNDRNFPTKGSELVFLSKVFLDSDYGIEFKEGVEGINLEIPSSDTTVFFPKEFFSEAVDASEPEPYATVFLDYRRFQHIRKNHQFITSFRAGGILATEGTDKIFTTFRLGGHQRVAIDDVRAYGFNYTELEPENFALIGLEYQYVLFGNLFLRAGVNGLATYRYVPLNNLQSFDAQDMWDNTTYFGYGVQGTFRTRLGPISAGASRNVNDPHWRYYFSYGFSFNYSD